MQAPIDHGNQMNRDASVYILVVYTVALVYTSGTYERTGMPETGLWNMLM
jgi:hypothetical protein